MGTILLEQQQILSRTNVARPPNQGWISINAAVARVEGQARPGATVVVGARPLRLRSAEGTESPVIGVLPPDTEVEIVRLGRRPWAEVVRR